MAHIVKAIAQIWMDETEEVLPAQVFDLARSETVIRGEQFAVAHQGLVHMYQSRVLMI